MAGSHGGASDFIADLLLILGVVFSAAESDAIVLSITLVARW